MYTLLAPCQGQNKIQGPHPWLGCIGWLCTILHAGVFILVSTLSGRHLLHSSAHGGLLVPCCICAWSIPLQKSSHCYYIEQLLIELQIPLIKLCSFYVRRLLFKYYIRQP